MNEFQAILVEVILFVLRFVIPILVIYGSVRVVHHFVRNDQTQDQPDTPETKVIH